MELDPNKVESAFQDTLTRIRNRTDAVFENPRPAFDAQLNRDVVSDAVRGRKIESFKRALDAAGFTWIPAASLGVWNDGRPHAEGEWHLRPNKLGLRFAFTETEILANFATPEALWDFMEEQKKRVRAARAGVVPG